MASSNLEKGQGIVASSQFAAGALALTGVGAPLAAAVGIGGIILGALVANRGAGDDD